VTGIFGNPAREVAMGDSQHLPTVLRRGSHGRDVCAEPDEIRRHGGAVVEQVSPYLENAADAVENDPCEEFGDAGEVMAAAYRAGREFLVRDLRGKVDLLHTFRDELDAVARNWESASEASTIRPN
jgi:hypothetical protein